MGCREMFLRGYLRIRIPYFGITLPYLAITLPYFEITRPYFVITRPYSKFVATLLPPFFPLNRALKAIWWQGGRKIEEKKGCVKIDTPSYNSFLDSITSSQSSYHCG